MEQVSVQLNKLQAEKSAWEQEKSTIEDKIILERNSWLLERKDLLQKLDTEKYESKIKLRKWYENFNQLKTEKMEEEKRLHEKINQLDQEWLANKIATNEAPYNNDEIVSPTCVVKRVLESDPKEQNCAKRFKFEHKILSEKS